MIIVSDPDIEQEAIALNIKATKDYFEGIVSNSVRDWKGKKTMGVGQEWNYKF